MNVITWTSELSTRSQQFSATGLVARDVPSCVCVGTQALLTNSPTNVPHISTATLHQCAPLIVQFLHKLCQICLLLNLAHLWTVFLQWINDLHAARVVMNARLSQL